MKIALLIAVPILLFSVPPTLADQSGKIVIQDISLTGLQFKVIEIAASEAKKRGLDISKYKISLVQQTYPWHCEDRPYHVLFLDPNRSEGLRGSSPNMPEFSVEVSTDYQVMGFAFAR